MKIYKNDTSKLAIKSWCDNLEDGAMDQAIDLANHPCVYHHVALMPDCHRGYGMPVGGVIATENAIIPNAVGVDIGCGMAACKSDYRNNLTEEVIKKILGKVRELIPVGFNKRNEKQIGIDENDIPLFVPVVKENIDKSYYQLGTLGGGNHFIEIQKDEDGFIWLMIHSGSRNIGLKIAAEYNKKAQELCKKWHSDIPGYSGQDGLAFLPKETKEYDEYVSAMQFATKYAFRNRELMMFHFKEAMYEFVNCSFDDSINIHHNYASIENHFGRNVWVHRKGATSAREGQIGIIPGSMGTSSYIVKGLGNRDSFQSCSHGAGRRMSRNEFCKTHTIEEAKKSMDGIVFGRWNKRRDGLYDISEAPGAYKDINEVMNSQKDLVEPLVKLEPLGCVKG